MTYKQYKTCTQESRSASLILHNSVKGFVPRTQTRVCYLQRLLLCTSQPKQEQTRYTIFKVKTCSHAWKTMLIVPSGDILCSPMLFLRPCYILTLFFLAYVYENIFKYFNEITWTRSSNSFSSLVSWIVFEPVFLYWRQFFRHDDRTMGLQCCFGWELPTVGGILDSTSWQLQLKEKKPATKKKFIVTICYSILFFNSTDIWV